jgi:hypothetical protein
MRLEQLLELRNQVAKSISGCFLNALKEFSDDDEMQPRGELPEASSLYPLPARSLARAPSQKSHRIFSGACTHEHYLIYSVTEASR